jgi:hypothetical protein
MTAVVNPTSPLQLRKQGLTRDVKTNASWKDSMTDAQWNSYVSGDYRGRKPVPLHFVDERPDDHEVAVEEFMRKVAEEDPERTAEVAIRYPVLSESELAWRRSREVRLSEKFENTISLCADIFGRRIALPRF